MKLSVIITIILISFISVAAQSSETLTQEQKIEIALLVHINAIRTSLHLPPLTIDTGLQHAAQSQSRECALRKTITSSSIESSHRTVERRLGQAGVTYRPCGEINAVHYIYDYQNSVYYFYMNTNHQLQPATFEHAPLPPLDPLRIAAQAMTNWMTENPESRHELLNPVYSICGISVSSALEHNHPVLYIIVDFSAQHTILTNIQVKETALHDGYTILIQGYAPDQKPRILFDGSIDTTQGSLIPQTSNGSFSYTWTINKNSGIHAYILTSLTQVYSAYIEYTTSNRFWINTDVSAQEALQLWY